MTNSYVQVATDGSGKKIDNVVQTREKPDIARDATTGDTVYSQVVVLGNPESTTNRVILVGEDGRAAVPINSESLARIEGLLEEIRDVLRIVCSL